MCCSPGGERTLLTKLSQCVAHTWRCPGNEYQCLVLCLSITLELLSLFIKLSLATSCTQCNENHYFIFHNMSGGVLVLVLHYGGVKGQNICVLICHVFPSGPFKSYKLEFFCSLVCLAVVGN